MSDAATAWALVSDDELVALSHACQGVWTRPLATVDVESGSERADAAARGYRSLMIRGLLEADSPDGAGLLLPLSLVGRKPVIMATWVTSELTQAPVAERYELFVRQDGQHVAVSTRPGGIHAFAPIEEDEGLSFFVDLAVAELGRTVPRSGGVGLCILVRGGDGRLSGGFVIHAGEAVRLVQDSSGAFTGCGGEPVSADNAQQWRCEIDELFQAWRPSVGRR